MKPKADCNSLTPKLLIARRTFAEQSSLKIISKACILGKWFFDPRWFSIHESDAAGFPCEYCTPMPGVAATRERKRGGGGESGKGQVLVGPEGSRWSCYASESSDSGLEKLQVPSTPLPVAVLEDETETRRPLTGKKRYLKLSSIFSLKNNLRSIRRSTSNEYLIRVITTPLSWLLWEVANWKKG